MPRHLTGEALIQATVMAHLRAHGVAAFHVPNETKGPVQWLAKRKALGVEAGVPDILIIDPPPATWGDDGQCLVGAALELKDGPKKPTDEQQRWLEKFAARRYAVAVEHSIDHALARLVFWGYLPATVLDSLRCPSSASSPRVSRSSASAKPPSSRASTRRRFR